MIIKEDLHNLYITQNKTVDEIAKELKCSPATVKRLLRSYSITKPKELHYKAIRKSTQDRYGVDSVAKLDSTKDKRERTNLERYGSKCSLANKEVRLKAENTCLTNNGVKYAFQSKEIQRKAKETLHKNYKVFSPTKSAEIIARIKQTNQNKYGTTSQRQAHIEHKDIWFDNEKLTNFIKQEKQTTHELSTFFATSISNINKKINELGVREFIKTSVSKEEQQIKDWLYKFNINTTKYHEGRFELDIYIPEKKVAIEFNGNYWHSTTIRKDANYHINKTLEAEKRGIFLYHIFEYDWYNKTDKVLNQLKNILGLNEQTIYARKCTIATVSSETASNFNELNHLHGNTQASVKLGLYYKNELVSLMTFGKPRFSNKEEWELVRFCSKAGTNVVGGASKLFKHFVKMFKPKSIVSYSDIAHTKGSLYRTLGFNMCGVTPANYVWVKHNKVLSRYQCQKHILLKQGFGSTDKTEDEIMSERGFVKIFDCGNIKHIWYNDKPRT